MRNIEESWYDRNHFINRQVTKDERFGNLIQKNDDSGENQQLDVFILEHIFISKVQGFRVLRSEFEAVLVLTAGF